jgi:hypothetical protein
VQLNLLRKLTEICLALPEATVERSGSHSTFRVRKKVFAYFLDNHHGDRIVSVCFKTHLGEHRDLVRHEPARFYLPAYIGPRDWADCVSIGDALPGAESRNSSPRATATWRRRRWSGRC